MINRSVRLEMKILLVLAPAVLIAMVYALTQGKLWVAGLLAFGVFLILVSYRREKRALGRRP
jgi:Flp pilus assembly protein TadB